MNKGEPATVVDHVTPWRTGGTEAERHRLFWDQANWQPLCASCHNATKQMEETHGYSQACGVDGIPVDAKHPWNM
jgi:5-methylcytosine-specific restriction enzyme A